MVEAAKSRPVWRTVKKLQRESKFSRQSPDSPSGEIEINGDKFKIEAIERSDSPELTEVQGLFERTFGKEEVDSEEILRAAVEGKTPFGTKDGVVYKVFVVKNAEGKVVSTVTGGSLDLYDEQNKPTGKKMFMVAYAVTDKECRQGGLAREAYTSAIMDSAIDAESDGKELAFAAGEFTYTSENFWNKVGWSRSYMENPEDPKKYEEVKYVQPALDFDEDTGLPAEGSGEAPEHLMIDSFGQQPPSKIDVMQTVRAFYRWNNIWPQEAFKDNPAAYQAHLDYNNKIADEFEGDLNNNGQLIFLTKEARERARGKGLLFREYAAADHGQAGKEDF
ncbi:MAG: hypothetical protein KGJ89_00400 [Patescibacteria group bacterium]|nr:hypothetical protein [Patescibacteria group bacterium]MDE2014981.1 hypothetical protein [Patescibacteria group bacterium]MDE2226410.1 hypothetical protein [Patescibacteria group bacterium]